MVFLSLFNIVLGMLLMVPGSLHIMEQYGIGWQFLAYVVGVSYLITMAAIRPSGIIDNTRRT